jgi:hypothetical protein
MSKSIQESTPVDDSPSMTQVRELLFGGQLKELEARFQRQEDALQREVENIRDFVKSRLDSLENFMKSECSTLLRRVQEEKVERESALKLEQRERVEAFKAEQRERAEALERLGKELAASSESGERKISKTAAMLDTVERELRDLLLAESNALSSKIDECRQNVMEVVSTTDGHLRGDLVYRNVLSQVLAEAAMKLNGQQPDTPDGAGGNA